MRMRSGEERRAGDPYQNDRTYTRERKLAYRMRMTEVIQDVRYSWRVTASYGTGDE